MPGRFCTLMPLALLLAGCSYTGTRQEGVFEAVPRSAVHGRQLNFGSGFRSFEDEDFGELDDQIVITLDFCEPMGYEHVRLEGGLHYSQEEDDQLDSGGMRRRLKGESYEISAGINASGLLGKLRPFVGLGISMLFLNLRAIDDGSGTIFDEDDVTMGGYVKAGLLFQISRTSHMGVEFRHFEGGDASLAGADLSTGYDQVVFVFGTSFQ